MHFLFWQPQTSGKMALQQFLRLKLRLPELSGALKWERHSEVTRYSLTLPLPELSEQEPAIPAALADWIAAIPGHPSSVKRVAQANRNTTSMSKRVNSIATR